MAKSVEISNSGSPSFLKQMQAFRSFKQAYPRYVGNIAVNFYKDSFRRQGFISDNTLERWTPRKHQDKKGRKRALLVKSGALRRSIRIIRSGVGYVVVGTDIAYAQIHNEGGTIRTTQRVGSYRRRPYTRTWKGKRQKIKASEVKAHARRINTTIPARPFIAPSSFLIRRIEMNTTHQLKRILNIR